MIRKLSFQKAVAYIFMLSVLLMASNVANSHDESGALPVTCSHKYVYGFSQVFFSFSEKNLNEHDVINFDVDGGDYFNIVMDLKTASGEVVQHADRMWYEINEGKFGMGSGSNWITLESAKTPEAFADMKKRLGSNPKVVCKILL